MHATKHISGWKCDSLSDSALTRERVTLEVNTEDWDFEKSDSYIHYVRLLELTRHRKNEMMDELTFVQGRYKRTFWLISAKKFSTV